MEGQSGATGLQLKVISFGPKLTRAKKISSGGGKGTAFGNYYTFDNYYYYAYP